MAAEPARAARDEHDIDDVAKRVARLSMIRPTDEGARRRPSLTIEQAETRLAALRREADAHLPSNR